LNGGGGFFDPSLGHTNTSETITGLKAKFQGSSCICRRLEGEPVIVI
jgi:hypothetical protein